jgi:hypothetical protein
MLRSRSFIYMMHIKRAEKQNGSRVWSTSLFAAFSAVATERRELGDEAKRGEGKRQPHVL